MCTNTSSYDITNGTDDYSIAIAVSGTKSGTITDTNSGTEYGSDAVSYAGTVCCTKHGTLCCTVARAVSRT